MSMIMGERVKLKQIRWTHFGNHPSAACRIEKTHVAKQTLRHRQKGGNLSLSNLDLSSAMSVSCGQVGGGIPKMMP